MLTKKNNNIWGWSQSPSPTYKEDQMKLIDKYLIEAEKEGYQSYYACYWYYHNKPIGYFNGSNVDYIIWINTKHAEFKPQSKHLNNKKYADEFLNYLKSLTKE